MDSILISAAVRRRQALAKKIGSGIVILTAPPEAKRSRDTYYTPYRQNSYLYYFSGCSEPHTALLLGIENKKITQEFFFCRPPDTLTARWEGKRLTPQSAKRQLAINDCADIGRLPQQLTELAARHTHLFYLPGNDVALDSRLSRLADTSRNQRGKRFPPHITDLSAIADEMRLIKDAEEIRRLRRAAAISSAGVMAAMRAAMTAQHEYEIEAEIIRTYRRHNVQHAFAPIVAGGRNACILHYTANNARLQKGKAVLVDSGCEYSGYAGDITRTFPADGVWRGGLSEVYAVVLAAQHSAIAAAIPGNTLRQVEQAAIRQLAAGLTALKLCRGSRADIIRRQLYRRFYMHSIGHFLGLDVHDVGAVTEADGSPRRLRPGMVLTIEPGLYIPAGKDIPSASPTLGGIGVRIEDDILITASGNECLTTAPKTPADIQAWMQDK